MTIDHIGIAVESIEKSLPFYKKALGLEPVHREDVASQKVKVAFLQAGETSLELLEPTSEDGAIAKFLKTRGPGLHHVAFSVKEIEKRMMGLAEIGLPALDTNPQAGSRGHRVCFLHPQFSNGVLIELVERA